MTKNKNNTTSVVIIFFTIVFFITGCFILTYRETNQVNFERVSFYTQDSPPVRIQSYYSPTDDFSKIKEHAKTVEWDEGGITHVFYFDDREYTPDIDHLGIRFAQKYEEHCIASFRKMTNGQTEFEKYPFR
ncbi:MAG: hypothetical protein K9M80_06130 [Candidatus Marinimicrobia bacterium]|nr:hypothetical protein [Candidatus Neomarinimicrobiota bacterium]